MTNWDGNQVICETFISHCIVKDLLICTFSEDYGNLTRIALAQHEIWQPDISLYNSATGSNNDYFGNTHFFVEPNGTVLWVPPATLRTFCDSDLRYWPYDSHKCTLLFGSWIYNGEEIDLEPEELTTKFDLFIENAEWEITEFMAGRSVTHYECCPDPYVDVRYNITIERRSPTYRTVVVAPAFVIMLMTLITFWLPATYGEKILLNGITILVVVLFLLYFAQKLNVMAQHTPLIGRNRWSNEKSIEEIIKIATIQFYFIAIRCIWCAFQRWYRWLWSIWRGLKTTELCRGL